MLSPAQSAASQMAVAAVEALQHPTDGGARARLSARLASVHLAAASHISVVLECSGAATELNSGNLLQAGSQASLLAGPTLAAACIRQRKSKLLRLAEGESPVLEDVASIVAECGCRAIVCVPLVVVAPEASGSCAAASAGADACCLGVLTVGLPSAAHITSPALKGALLLAHALATEQRAPLGELAALVASILLPPPARTPALDGEHGGSAAGWDSEGEGEDWQGGERGYAAWGPSADSDESEQRSASAGASPSADAGQPLAPRRALLAFASCGLERRFAAYHAAHMLRVDGWAYLLCFSFFCVECFLPGTPFRLVERMGWRCAMGVLSLLPGALLLSQRTRGWYVAHRDQLLGCTWAAVTCWQMLVSNYLHFMSRRSFRHPLYLQSYGWLTVMGLAFQMRFRFQALAAPLSFAANIVLLPAICAKFYDEQPAARCVGLGAVRVLLHGVLLPLACCYVFETHARRLFLRADARWHA